MTAKASPASGAGGTSENRMPRQAMMPHTEDSRCICPSVEAAASRDLMSACGPTLYEEAR